MRREAAGGGILNQVLLQGSQVLWKVNVRAGFKHRTGKAVTKQAGKRIAKSEFRPQAQAAEKAGAGAPQADEVIAAVGTRAQDRVHHSQFSKRQPQHSRGKQGRVGPDHNHPRVLPEQLRKGVLEPLRQVAALLPPAFESGRDDFPGQRSACCQHVAGGISLELCHLSQRIGNQRPVELGCPVRPQRGNQPRFGFSPDDRTGKNRNRCSRAGCARPAGRWPLFGSWGGGK